MTLPGELAEVDAIFERFAARDVVPGFAWGVVIDGDLAHHGAHGTLRAGQAAPPDLDSVFRIASMTKSFTAATVLLLRDEGRLRLDDPVADWLPELAGQPGLTTDSPPLTIRHLLTMSGGLPTDDPWGDRQQGLPLDRFAELLGAGVSLAWAPDTRFEYSNLGYGVLGRIVTRAAGVEYRDVVRARLLEPLGMLDTTYQPDEVPADRLARGFVRRDDAWIPEPIDAYGALAPMGGVLTTVRDLARWVAGFTAAFPPRDDAPDAHPLTRASRREMQQAHRHSDPELRWTTAAGMPELNAGGYGYGLFCWDDLRFGRFVGHGGGYPGYGSHMRWHTASGIGVIGFGNARYAPIGQPVREALVALVAGRPTRTRRIRPWPETLAAQASVERLLGGWDDDLAAGLFAMNIELDEPLERRRAAIERLTATHGTLRRDGSEDPVSHSPAHLAWWMVGDRGRVHLDVLMSPERPPRVQRLTVTSVPEPPTALAAIAERVAELLGTPGPAWPDDIDLAEAVDRDALGRALRAAEAGWGPVVLGPVIAGDGRTVARWRLWGDRRELEVELSLAPDGDETPGAVTSVPRLTAVTIVPRSMLPPDVES